MSTDQPNISKTKANPRRANGTKRNRVRRRVLTEEDTCWLCGQPVDKTLTTPHPASAEVDEVIPVSHGGNPFDRANCRLAHRVCNQQRSNGNPRRVITPITTTRHW